MMRRKELEHSIKDLNGIVGDCSVVTDKVFQSDLKGVKSFCSLADRMHFLSSKVSPVDHFRKTFSVRVEYLQKSSEDNTLGLSRILDNKASNNIALKTDVKDIKTKLNVLGNDLLELKGSNDGVSDCMHSLKSRVRRYETILEHVQPTVESRVNTALSAFGEELGKIIDSVHSHINGVFSHNDRIHDRHVSMDTPPLVNENLHKNPVSEVPVVSSGQSKTPAD